MHPAEDAPDLPGLENKVGQLTRLCAQGSGPRLRSGCAPLLPAQTLQELRPWEELQGYQGNFRDRTAERGKRGGMKHEGRGRPAGSEVLQAWLQQLLPAGLGCGHTRCGGGDFGGVPAQLAQLGPRKKGGRWDSPPGTQPVCRVGRGGAAPASLGDSLCRRPSSMPRF